MRWERQSHLAAALAPLLALVAINAARADDQATAPADVTQELSALKARVAELEAKENQNWLTQERTAQIKAIVNDVLKDAKTRGEFSNGMDAGYKDGFYIQTSDKNYKLVVNGYIQVRYEFDTSNAYNGRTLPPRPVGNPPTNVIPDDPSDASGFSVRKARISFSGNVVSPDVTYKLEGDFYGSASGAFTVTDAWAGYRFNDLVKVRAGSFKVPFAKAELTQDPLVTTPEREEVLTPFDPIRAIGVSVYGDIIQDTLNYEVNANNGSQSNTLRRPDTTGLTPNFDNRMAFYARLQWAGNGKLSAFAEEADLRVDNRAFIWMVGMAGGYESQNSSNDAFPSPQTTQTGGLSNNGPGFINYTLNGDLYRATIDWSAKYQGLSLLAAAYFQQFNANPGHANLTGTGGNPVTTGPYGAADASFFQDAYYGQIGYFVIPQHLELVGRAGVLYTEGYPNVGEFYTIGANYYFYGPNLKIQSDMTYTPEAAFTDAADATLQNTHDLIFRLQLQLKF